MEWLPGWHGCCVSACLRRLAASRCERSARLRTLRCYRAVNAACRVQRGADCMSAGPLLLSRHAGAQELVEEQAALKAQLDAATAWLRGKQLEEARRAAELEEVRGAHAI